MISLEGLISLYEIMYPVCKLPQPFLKCNLTGSKQGNQNPWT